MIDLTTTEKDKNYFITNLECIDNKIIVTRANKEVTEEIFSEHNLGVYRNRIIEQLNDNLETYMDKLSKETFPVELKKYASIIISLTGLYFLYNIDIHIVMKIIITILIILIELGYYLYSELYLEIRSSEVRECLAYEYYLENIKEFRYFNRDSYTDGYIVPPEDIAKYQLSKETLEEILKTINNLKDKGFESEDIFLNYKSKENNYKSML